MNISIVTLFPQILPPLLNSSILGQAQRKKLVQIHFYNPRNYAKDKYRTVDDKPYGGGVGMLLRVDVIEQAVQEAKNKLKIPAKKTRTILLDPKGSCFSQTKARELVKYDHLIMVCGHYEGIDARIDKFVEEKISIGNYILTQGEIPALVLADAVIRLIPGVLPPNATKYESFSKGKTLEWPQYTRPETYKGLKVPKVLLSGNHKEIEKWKIEQIPI